MRLIFDIRRGVIGWVGIMVGKCLGCRKCHSSNVSVASDHLGGNAAFAGTLSPGSTLLHHHDSCDNRSSLHWIGLIL